MVDLGATHIDPAVAAVREFLGGPHPDGDRWRFDFGEHLESNWGAVYGGALAAGALAVARCAAPDRSPRSLHVQIVRSVSRGIAHATAEVRHAGRTVATVEVELYDEREKLAAVALLTMVTPDAVASDQHNTSATPFEESTFRSAPENLAKVSPVSHALGLMREREGVIVATAVENVRPNVDGSVAAGLHATLPWQDLDATGPEAACLIADAIVGAPLGVSSLPLEVVGPNADLSLRFTTAPAARVLTAAAMILSVQHGTATVALEVQAGDQQLAHGLATSLLLPPR